MDYKRILTIQDISCVGQCSLTVALPVISACGVEAAVLPSAVLSTHTAGFQGWTFRDLTEDMPAIARHWKAENLSFDAIYTGYLGSARQIEYVTDIFGSFGKGKIKVVDPAMADGGRLYTGFDMAFVQEMKKLCRQADFLVPNLTEACLLTDIEYKENYERDYIDAIIESLCKMGCKNIVLTGISYQKGKTGVVVYENGEYRYYEHRHIDGGCHGTGDIYASAFVGALMRGKSTYTAASIAADFVLECIKETHKDPSHRYGARFEPVLEKLIQMLKN